MPTHSSTFVANLGAGALLMVFHVCTRRHGRKGERKGKESDNKFFHHKAKLTFVATLKVEISATLRISAQILPDSCHLPLSAGR
jgi:hypothetical protein